MIVKPKTLDVVHQLPQRRVADFSSRKMSPVHHEINNFLGKCGLVSPMTEAINFYTLNHLVSILQQKYSRYETLPAEAVEIVDAYARTVSDQVTRFVIYLMMICMRESRHDKSQNQTHIDTLREEFGDEAFQFIHKTIGAVCSGGISPPQAISRFLKYDKFVNCTIGQFFGMVVRVFERGSFGSAFGGYRWVTCAKPLYEWMTGKISGEALVDIGYTLAHNGGPIFNKGMTYEGAPHRFRQLLDVQRAGFLPEALLTLGVSHSDFHLDLTDYEESPLRNQIKWVKEHCPGTIGEQANGAAIAKASAELKKKIEALEAKEKAEIAKSNAEVLQTKQPKITTSVDKDYVVDFGYTLSPTGTGKTKDLKVPEHGKLQGFYAVMPEHTATLFTRVATDEKANAPGSLNELLGIAP